MRKLIVLPLFMLLALVGMSQEESSEKADSVMSLQQAIDFAMKHNHDVQKAKLEVIKARKKVWETTSIGLPQVSASAAYSYMLTVPEALEQFASLEDMFGPIYEGIGTNNAYLQALAQVVNQDLPADQQINVPPMEAPEAGGEATTTDDLRTTATLDITVTQLIFNGSYIVGLQASKTYKKLSKYMEQQTVINLKETVTNAYTGVLIAKESLNVLENILKSTKESIREMEAMYEEGFIENTDVDQLRLTAATIETTKKNLELQIKTAREMLKLTLGMELEQPLKLSDNLDAIMQKSNATTAKGFDFDVTQNVNYQLLETQEKLKELDVKNVKAEFLPTVAAYYNHQENFNDKAFNLQPPDVVGVSIDIPIFSSWGRMSKLAQKKIELEQTRHDKANATNGLKIQYRNTLNQYLTALNTYNNNKSNMELAKRIYEKTQVKYKEGVSTSFDLSQAQNQYLQAQSKYFQSIMKLIEAKSGLDKLSHQYQPIEN